jgi:hypothetical protein
MSSAAPDPDAEARRKYELHDARRREEERTGLTYQERVRLRTLRWKWARLTVSDR